VAVRGLAWMVALMALSATLAAPPALKLEDAWVRWIPAPVPNTALYGVFVNPTDHDVRLVGATTVVAASCMPMTTRKEDTGSPSGPVVSMVKVDALSIPAHGRRALQPGGDHLMLMGLNTPLTAGADVEITLLFEGAAPLTVRVPILRK
jgi:periplasmic copper chaperone A